MEESTTGTNILTGNEEYSLRDACGTAIPLLKPDTRLFFIVRPLGMNDASSLLWRKGGENTRPPHRRRTLGFAGTDPTTGRFAMKFWWRNGRIFLLSLLGGALGYLVLHPYAMLVYGLYGIHGAAKVPTRPVPPFREVLSSFDPAMLPMGIPFALLGGVAGLSLGFWMEVERQRFEMEKRLLTVETVRRLMTTLAHYLLNAAQIVGGFAARDIRKEQDETIRHHLEAMRDEAMRIEGVVRSLLSLESVKSRRFLENRDSAMIDIQNELRDRLEGLKRNGA